MNPLDSIAHPAPPFATEPLSEQEHLVLVKHLARLQKQMSQLVHSYESQLRHWQRQLMRQSIRLMLERTRGDWGLVRARATTWHAADPQVRGTLAVAEAEALICRTGCVMDDQHWREGDLCRLSGRDCVAASSVVRKT